MLFKDRHYAGQLLSEKLTSYKGQFGPERIRQAHRPEFIEGLTVEGQRALVVGLARGGVVIARTVASLCELPLDVLVVKKIPSPYDPELAIGALAPDGISYVDWKFAQRVGADEKYIKSQITNLNDQIRQKTLIYRKGRKPINVKDRIVILVDDGAATGATMEAAVLWAQKKHARRIVIALPVAPKELIDRLKPKVAQLVVLDTPADFSSVGQFYEQFRQVEDEEVVELLRREDQKTVRL